jgi:hypothetical protein
MSKTPSRLSSRLRKSLIVIAFIIAGMASLAGPTYAISGLFGGLTDVVAAVQATFAEAIGSAKAGARSTPAHQPSEAGSLLPDVVAADAHSVAAPTAEAAGLTDIQESAPVTVGVPVTREASDGGSAPRTTSPSGGSGSAGAGGRHSQGSAGLPGAGDASATAPMPELAAGGQEQAGPQGEKVTEITSHAGESAAGEPLSSRFGGADVSASRPGGAPPNSNSPGSPEPSPQLGHAPSQAIAPDAFTSLNELIAGGGDTGALPSSWKLPGADSSLLPSATGPDSLASAPLGSVAGHVVVEETNVVQETSVKIASEDQSGAVAVPGPGPAALFLVAAGVAAIRAARRRRLDPR